MDTWIGTDAPRTHAALARGRLYNFFELALAHPAPEGLEYFRDETTASAYASNVIAAAGDATDALTAALTTGERFFGALRVLDDPQAEAAHINLFSAGFPTLPCPPYGSLFLVDGDKRLDEMRNIKQFYQRHGFDIDESFDDLPDHLCVELEFMQALSFREYEAMSAGDDAAAQEARAAQSDFLGRFLQPFAAGIARAAAVQGSENAYASLLGALHDFLRTQRLALETPDAAGSGRRTQ
ncbi:MAG: molecular chaperone TorD family protein [Rubrivivax sp.]